MNVRVGIYDFFSYLIPGSVFSFAILYSLNEMGIKLIDPQTASSFEFFVSVGTAYILGFVVDVISKPWLRIFEPQKKRERIIQKFSYRYPAFKQIFYETDWYTFLVFIKRNDLDIGRDIEQNNATSIMLRNLSFAVLCLGVSLLTSLFSPGNTLIVVPSFFCVVISLILQRQSIKFKTWFYLGLYQAVIGLLINEDDFYTGFNRSVR